MSFFTRKNNSNKILSPENIISGKPIYMKPKVLLLDLEDSENDALIEMGLNVSVGSLGKPYKVNKSSNYQRVICESNLPNYTEQEVVVVDFHYGLNIDSPQNKNPNSDDEEFDLWAKCNFGFIDSRVRAAYEIRESFNRILSQGGIFIIFADEKSNIQFQYAKLRYDVLREQTPVDLDIWGLLSDLDDIKVSSDHGYEMQVTEDNSSLTKLLSEHLDGGQFFCTLKGGVKNYKNTWVTNAKNKFGNAVAISNCLDDEGTIIVLPQIAKRIEFLRKLFSHVLPEISPGLFPHITKRSWVHHPDYELKEILTLQDEQNKVEEKAKTAIESLQEKIDIKRLEDNWIHDLLTSTGDDLVDAVIKALSELGFNNVVDVDKERDSKGESRREDLQLLDDGQILVVDIKGINNFPSDEDALQADKHAVIRIRELKRVDITGLSIINHQRHLPPLSRENLMPFRQELIEAASERKLGLMTTWDLYRLLLNKRKNNWNGNNVKPILYKAARIEAIPEHYKYIGSITKAWSDKFGIVLENSELSVDDQIAIEFPITFDEAKVSSIFINNIEVTKASVGEGAGLPWPSSNQKITEGLRVFKVLN